MIALGAWHWEIIIFFLTEKTNSKEAIAFIQENTSLFSFGMAVGTSLLYVIAFPWIELVIAYVSSFGKRKRNDFHTKERENEINRRKKIAQEQAQIIEIELKNKLDQSKLVDIELAKNYQATLSGENFVRWLNDLQNGAFNNNLTHSISSYLNKVDSIEGKFFNPQIESAHARFVNDLSTLGSALSSRREPMDKESASDINIFCRKAFESHQAYRLLVRELLGV